MYLVDANILIYAYDNTSPLHRPAKDWWEKRLSNPEPIRLAWPTIAAYLRIVTHPRIFANPFTLDEAISHVDEWLQQPMADTLETGDRHWQIFQRFLQQGQALANLVNDAHLAALAVEHGATLCSTDQDFSRFEGLTWSNPLR